MTQIFRVSTNPDKRNAVIRVNDHMEDNIVVYPGEYFANGHRPVLRVPQSVLTDDNLCRVVNATIRGLADNIEAIVEFMFRMMLLITFNLVGEPWMSFNLRIGENDRPINPTDILEIHRYEVVHGGQILGAECDLQTRWKTFWGLVSMFRIMIVNESPEQVYKEKVRTQVSRIFAAAPFAVVIADYTAYGRQKSILCEASDYSMLIAALDMYFVKFPKHIYAPCRISTIPTRRRACTALTGLSDVAESVGRKPSELLKFIFDEVVGDDAARIGKDGQEMGETHSYSNYLHDFRLTTKSPYSASVNKYLHYWMHVIGCICGSTRSMNAKVLPTVPTGLMVTGIIAGEVLRKNKNVGLQYTHSAQRRDNLVAEEVAAAADVVDQIDTPEATLQALIQRNYTIPEDRKLALRGVVGFLRASRVDTVGRAVADYLGIIPN